MRELNSPPKSGDTSPGQSEARSYFKKIGLAFVPGPWTSVMLTVYEYREAPKAFGVGTTTSRTFWGA